MTALNVLICEDEYLLAIDLASELGKRGIAVAGIIPTVAATLEALKRDDFVANAAVLDVQLLDGMAYPLVAPMLARGMTVVFCTGYGQRDLPEEFAHYPSVGKPTDVDRLLAAFEGVAPRLSPPPDQPLQGGTRELARHQRRPGPSAASRHHAGTCRRQCVCPAAEFPISDARARNSGCRNRPLGRPMRFRHTTSSSRIGSIPAKPWFCWKAWPVTTRFWRPGAAR